MAGEQSPFLKPARQLQELRPQLESPLIPFCIICQRFPSPCFPAFRSLSLCWLRCSRWLSSAEMKAHCPREHKGRGLTLPAASSAHTQTAGGEGTFTLLMELRCPQWLMCVLLCAPGVCHPGTVCATQSASTRICSWSQCRAPTRDPAMSTSRRV